MLDAGWWRETLRLEIPCTSCLSPNYPRMIPEGPVTITHTVDCITEKESELKKSASLLWTVSNLPSTPYRDTISLMQGYSIFKHPWKSYLVGQQLKTPWRIVSVQFYTTLHTHIRTRLCHNVDIDSQVASCRTRQIWMKMAPFLRLIICQDVGVSLHFPEWRSVGNSL